MNKIKGFFALLGTGFVFGSFGIFIKLLGHELNSYEQVVFRHLVGLGVVIALGFFIKIDWSLKRVKKKYVFFYCLLYPLSILFVTLAFMKTKVAVAIFSVYASEITTSLVLGNAFFQEKLTKIKLFSLILVVLGIYSITYPFSIKHTNMGMIYGVLSGFLWSISNAFLKHFDKKIERSLLVFLQMLSGTVIGSALVLIVNGYGYRIPSISINAWMVGLAFGALLVLVGYLLVYGFQNYDLNLGTIVVSSELFFTPLFAMIIFKEIPTFFEILGGVFIALAVVLPQLRLNQTKKSVL